MKWWQVAMKVRTEPGLNHDAEVTIIFDVEAVDRENAVVLAKAALVARATVHFAIAGETVD